MMVRFFDSNVLVYYVDGQFYCGVKAVNPFK